jgi:hypothetical protein
VKNPKSTTSVIPFVTVCCGEGVRNKVTSRRTK